MQVKEKKLFACCGLPVALMCCLYFSTNLAVATFSQSTRQNKEWRSIIWQKEMRRGVVWGGGGMGGAIAAIGTEGELREQKQTEEGKSGPRRKWRGGGWGWRGSKQSVEWLQKQQSVAGVSASSWAAWTSRERGWFCGSGPPTSNWQRQAEDPAQALWAA